jgi:hypothetical protein
MDCGSGVLAQFRVAVLAVVPGKKCLVVRPAGRIEGYLSGESGRYVRVSSVVGLEVVEEPRPPWKVVTVGAVGACEETASGTAAVELPLLLPPASGGRASVTVPAAPRKAPLSRLPIRGPRGGEAFSGCVREAACLGLNVLINPVAS